MTKGQIDSLAYVGLLAPSPVGDPVHQVVRANGTVVVSEHILRVENYYAT
jgi:hypothetical protein